MFKFLIICVLFTSISSGSIEFFEGRWMPILLYSNTLTNKTEQWVGWHGDDYIVLWTGWLLETKECGWVYVNNIGQNCTCDNRNVSLVQLHDNANLNERQFYQFRLNEARPIIVVDSINDVQEALSAKCKCGHQEMKQLVFRKTSYNHLMVYENKGMTDNSPNMTLVMLRFVPTMLDLQRISKSPNVHLDIPYQMQTLMCDPMFFDDSAYVVDSSENETPFLTLGDIKNDKMADELKKLDCKQPC